MPPLDRPSNEGITMSPDALAIVRTYHDAWTRNDFDQATSLLADRLEVEVPINDYPTTESFAGALRGFGSLARKVDLLSQMSDGNTAMLLYDMDVQGLGRLRVVEHFTVEDGRIARIRQIHDTAALRAAGFA
jgi:ketosteroid isomerase-like protein